MTLGGKTLDDLLAPIARQLGRDAVPADIPDLQPPARPARPTDGLDRAGLVELFADEAEKVRVHVRRCTRDDVAAAVAGIVSADAGAAMLADDIRFADLGVYTALQDALGAENLAVWDAAKGLANVEVTRNARYGVTIADAAIAETGTVLQLATPKCGRSISLLPLVHIAVVYAGDVQATMADVLGAYGEQGASLPSQLCFLSGPSATADIELVRVEGVHGPMYVHYVVVE